MKWNKAIRAMVITCLLPYYLLAQAVNSHTSIGRQLEKRTDLISKMLGDTVYTIVPGLTETDLNYINTRGEPMHVFILQADLSKKDIHLELLTPFNKPAIGRQTITDMIRYANAKQHRVVAAVNGDFFNLDSGAPLGIAYKDGIAVKDTFNTNKEQQGLTYLGLSTLKKIFIGTRQDGRAVWSKLNFAAGSGVYLVKDFKPVKQTIKAIHPRTCVGIAPNNKIYFMVADGRDPGYSMGMNYSEMGIVMETLGVKDAVNLDGGGSSEIVVKNPGTKQYEVRNKPSDKAERPVSNAWAIIYTGKNK